MQIEIIDESNVDPIVSIAMLAYNHESYIHEALDSVLMQKTSFDYKIIIAEDFSTDSTRKIILEYQKKNPKKIKIILQNQNVGASLNNLSLFKNLEGKYIAALEGDDYWTDPLKLQKQFDVMENDPLVGLVHTNYSILSEKTNTIIPHKKVTHNANAGEYENYLFTGDIRTLTVMFKTEYLQNILKLFQMSFMQNSPVGDRALIMFIGSKAKIIYLNEITGVYRIGTNDSASNFKSIKKHYSTLLKVVSLNLELYSYLKIENTSYLSYLRRRKRFLELQIDIINNKKDYFKKIVTKTLKDFWNINEIKEFIFLFNKRGK